MNVVDHWVRQARRVKANTLRYRSGTRKIAPKYCVIHETTGRLDKFSTVKYLAGRNVKVSYHFVIERDGTITQQVPCDTVAWHAGKSRWEGRSGLNSCSIGIGMVGPGPMDQDGRAWFGPSGASHVEHRATKEHGDAYWLAFTDEQMRSLTSLVETLSDAYPDLNSAVTHWQISPGRKVDPHPLFDIELFNEMAFNGGVEPVEADDEKPGDPPKISEPAKAVGLTAITGGVAAVGSFFSVSEQAVSLFGSAPSWTNWMWPAAIMSLCALAATFLAYKRHRDG